MRKNRLIIFIWMTFSLFFSSVSYSGTEIGQVLKVKNKAYLIRDGRKNDAEPEMILLHRDIVETDIKSRTQLSFKDDSVLNLGELSRVEVDEYLERPESNRSRAIYRLVDGFLHVVVGRSDLEIHTPTALTAARGTEFIIWVEGSGDSRHTGIVMMKGEGNVRNAAESIEGAVTLIEGQMTRVFLNEPPENLQQADNDLMNKLIEKTGEINTSSVVIKDSDVKGAVIKRSNIRQSSNITAGQGATGNMGSIIIKDSKVSGNVINESDVKQSANVAAGDSSEASTGSVVVK